MCLARVPCHGEDNGEEEEKRDLPHEYQPAHGYRHQGEADDENRPIADPVPEAAKQDFSEDTCDADGGDKAGRHCGGYPQVRGMGGDMHYDGEDGKAETEKHSE